MAAIDCIQLGGGQPAIYSDESYIPALVNRGISFGGRFGLFNRWLCGGDCGRKAGNRPSGSAFVNLGKIMEIAVNGGTDPATGTRLISQKGL